MPTTSEAIAAAVAPVAATFNTATTVTVDAGPTWYAIHAKKDSDEADVRIYDAIGAWGITADAFVRDLARVSAKTINLRLNTPGGEVFAATAIHNALVEHPARVVVHVDGVAASAGSFIAMAGDEVRVADNAYVMIHNARGGVMGEAEDMRRYADLLEKMNHTIAGMYERKSGKSREHWRGLMDAETWFTAEEAKAEGLADTVYAAEKRPARATASFDFKIYNKIPDPVREMWGLTPPAPVAASPNVQPPEVSPSVGEPVPANSAKEPNTMSEPIAAPATATVAVAPVSPAPDINTVAGLEKITAQNHFDRGVAQGRLAERVAQQDLMRNLMAAAPGKVDIAVNAFLTGQSPESVKLAFNAAQGVEQAMNAQIAALQLENARQLALASAGGYVGGVPTGVSKDDDQMAFAPGTPPETQAKMEWDGNYNNCRNSGATEKQFTLARVAQLKGNVAVLKKN